MVSKNYKKRNNLVIGFYYTNALNYSIYSLNILAININSLNLPKFCDVHSIQ